MYFQLGIGIPPRTIKRGVYAILQCGRDCVRWRLMVCSHFWRASRDIALGHPRRLPARADFSPPRPWPFPEAVTFPTMTGTCLAITKRDDTLHFILFKGGDIVWNDANVTVATNRR